MTQPKLTSPPITHSPSPDPWTDLGVREAQPNRFGRCILHIGTEKTGTTAWQGFLSANREALLRAGYFVPSSLSPYARRANHERLTTLALADAKIADDLRQSARVTTAADVPRHRASVTEALRQEIAALPADTPNASRTLLLSNEHCQSRLTEPAEVERLRDFLTGFARDIRIVVYLRPQHELAVSLYDQALKSGYADIPLPPDFSGRLPLWVHRGFFDYAELLDRWSAAFGREAIDVRIYGPAALRGGNVIDDFCAHLGLDAADYASVTDTNRSMSEVRQRAMNAINRSARAGGQKLTPLMRHNLIETFMATSDGPGRRPGRRAAIAFYQSFALSNERVRADYLPDRETLFDPDFAGYPDHPADPDEAEALAATILAQQDIIERLRRAR
jgi:hypothetical protein